MKLLTLEHILMLHVCALNMGGGSEGVRDMGRLDAVIATQTQEVFGEALYVTVFEKGAALIRGIVGDHPFSDGNKRTAMLVGLTFLEINGCRIVAGAGDIEDFAVQIAVEHLAVADNAKWLEKHTRTSRS